MGTLKHVNEHFTRSRYRELPAILAGLARRKRIHAVRVVEDGSEWPGGWYVQPAATHQAGSLLRELWGEGQKMRAEEMLKEVTGSTLEMEAVAERVREMLT